jgi:hypothetical protein
MPPVSQFFLSMFSLESMLPELSICLMLLFKGSPNLCRPFLKFLTLHVDHPFTSESQNHMNFCPTLHPGPTFIIGR